MLGFKRLCVGEDFLLPDSYQLPNPMFQNRNQLIQCKSMSLPSFPLGISISVIRQRAAAGPTRGMGETWIDGAGVTRSKGHRNVLHTPLGIIHLQ